MIIQSVKTHSINMLCNYTTFREKNQGLFANFFGNGKFLLNFLTKPAHFRFTIGKKYDRIVS